MRYTENTFTEIHLTTVGLDYKLKNFKFDDGKTVKVQIWDTAGQERYKTITKSYIKGAKGIIIANVTLHVGIGTFRPVKEETVENHEMHSEHFYIKKEDVEKINNAKQNGNRVIAVGTTSCRVLESIADDNGFVKETEGDTKIFIYPGYKFKCLDGLITNFHLPQSTLLMLVSALAGKEYIMKAYEEAVKEKYRFFSFGDAMLII